MPKRTHRRPAQQSIQHEARAEPTVLVQQVIQKPICVEQTENQVVNEKKMRHHPCSDMILYCNAGPCSKVDLCQPFITISLYTRPSGIGAYWGINNAKLVDCRVRIRCWKIGPVVIFT